MVGIQNHRQEKIQNHFLDPKKKNSEHHNYKDEQRKVQRDPITSAVLEN